MQFAFASLYLSRVISFFKICFCSFHFDSVSFLFRFEKIVSRSRANHIIWRALKELDLLSFASRATLTLFDARCCTIKHAIRQLLSFKLEFYPLSPQVFGAKHHLLFFVAKTF